GDLADLDGRTGHNSLVVSGVLHRDEADGELVNDAVAQKRVRLVAALGLADASRDGPAFLGILVGNNLADRLRVSPVQQRAVRVLHGPACDDLAVITNRGDLVPRDGDAGDLAGLHVDGADLHLSGEQFAHAIPSIFRAWSASYRPMA